MTSLDALGSFNIVDEFIKAFSQVEDAEKRCELISEILPYLYQCVDPQPDGPGEETKLLRLIQGG